MTLAGLQTRTLPGERGILDPELVRPHLRAFAGEDNYRLVRTAVLAVENTVVRGGGAVWPVDRLVSLRQLTAEAGVAFHCDGAWIWNAAVALGVPLSDLGTQFDTLSVCLSKGLGAPVGSLVVTSGGRVAEARLWRKRLGRKTMGFGSVCGNKNEQDLADILPQVQTEDILEFGMIPELIGRLPVISSLSPLDHAGLVRVLTEPKNALLKQYQTLFEMEDCQLEFSDSALDAIAAKALSKGTGARGLRSIVDTLASEEFPRVRVGIRKGDFAGELADYVLDPFPDADVLVVQEMVDRAADAVLVALADGVTAAMNRFNGSPQV